MGSIGRRPSADGTGPLKLVRSGRSSDWELQGSPLLSRTLIDLQVVGSGWVSGLFMWSGDLRDPPLLRILVPSIDGGPPIPVDVPIPCTGVMRRAATRI
jgi:hypothetical protein